MEEWQGCLAPHCQTALVNARGDVERRGGCVITVEDYLLALLDDCPSVASFLRSCGIDMDELVRTIQCEQPIVTEVGGEGLLSSQLIDWFASARQINESPWLDWPVLLEVLTHKVERLQSKAYVAVLELVQQWPRSSDPGVSRDIEDHTSAPVVVAEPAWVTLAEEVGVTLSANPSNFVWVRGERGSGKSCWLQHLLSVLNLDTLELDLRRESDVLASDVPVVPSDNDARWPVLILDNTSPSDLMALMSKPESVSAELVSSWQGPMLLIGPTSSDGEERVLSRWLGRSFDVFDMPSCSPAHRKTILVAHQAAIEKRWNVELPQSVIQYAATRQSRCVASPGGMLQWVERAAARLDMLARRGPGESLVMAGREDSLNRQKLVALARGEPVSDLDGSLDELRLQQTAADVAWQERKSANRLRRLTIEDLRRELERWVAARPGPVHYVLHREHQDGDPISAGS
ncbi:hypothetical protein D777_00508 [Marinobacter nitratireducens]|uniref:Uncharacterized protein n=1 Tax=Marinobacter nitratireducens TaxID=1137280 RepID=A0A072N5Z4_9GAMM|nr:hypothetical protein [Marinobacter nitratireducens]KEF32946.1 hypothetical protein D777_00508 [Marinobacter nitratireducens]